MAKVHIDTRKAHELKWYAIDLDGCLAEAIWPDPGVGEPIVANVAKLMEVHRAGYNIVIHTSRHSGDYEMIEEWLEVNNVPYKMILCGKPLVHRYVDDKAINSEEDSWL